MAGLKPSEELVAASFAVATVVSVFGAYNANVNDVAAAAPSNATHNDQRRSALVAGAIVSGIALIAKSPTVFVVGGAAIILESVVRAHANFTMPKTS